MSWAADQPRAGHWMVRCCRACPAVAARIWWAHTTADPVSGEPMERSPFLAAQIGLDIAGWREVWRLVEFIESSPEQQQVIASPPLSDRAPRHGRSPGLTAAPMPRWQQQRARRITSTEYLTEIEWLGWAERNQPQHHDFTFRRAVDPRTAQVPRFA